jgi:hypothetical protein
MARRRDHLEQEVRAAGLRQLGWAFRDPRAILEEASQRGETIFEIPDASRLSNPARRRAARTSRPPSTLASIGLPLGTLELGGRLACWACARPLQEHELISSDAGEAPRCPGCGARLPVR